MFWLWFVLVVGQCALLFILARTGEALPRRAREEAAAAAAMPDAQWPAAALIVPVAGADPRMEGALRSLLTQDYPGLAPVLVTATESEPAAELVTRLCKDFPATRHVVAGPAQGCGQKNHNLLAGVDAVGPAAEVYLFCDSTHQAAPDLARQLAGPLVRGEAAFTTGYHEVDPGDSQTATLGYAFCVMLMRLLQAMGAFTQLWGGAMGMSRAAFKKYGVRSLWSETVVDDCSLTALLQVRGAGVRLCPGALLRTEAANHPPHVWRAWMDRQVLFLKFCMPGQWLLLGLLAVMTAVPVLGAVLSLLGWLLHLGGGAGVLLTLFWLAATAGALYLWRALLPRPVSLLRWLWAYGRSVCLFARVYAASVGATGIAWRGIRYVVGRGGVVRETSRQ
ncbi:glycosyltransferase family 2 protein [uncultured Desulfovibrio sp.]|uniref:glycosyltransferase family 2 protein n=1 Tax=Desulfovibrio legallii TaxID=571438 RepID=UPI00259A4E4D|nr:glycosyltransferase family 2 protein [uncultured Desulfovibrio sp.]